MSLLFGSLLLTDKVRILYEDILCFKSYFCKESKTSVRVSVVGVASVGIALVGEVVKDGGAEEKHKTVEGAS